MAVILVVDDEIGIRELLSEILSDEGYGVLLAENASAARSAMTQHPDLVLLDIWMPDNDGVSLLKEWNATGQLNVPVIMMSGHATLDTAVEATKFGAVDFLEKPIEAEKLDAVLENCWNRWNVKNSGQSPQEIAAIFHEMSEREKGIVRLLVQELTSKQIGDRLGLSERTVQGHRLNLYKKFGVHTRDELLSCLKVMEELSD